MQSTISYLAARMKEASSFAGMTTLILTGMHVSANPTLINLSLGAVAAVGSLLAFLYPEKGSPK